MRVKLSNGELLEVKEPTQKHQLDYIDYVERHEKSQKSKADISGLIEFQNAQVAELTSKSLEEVRNMNLVDKNKIMEAIKSRYVYVGPCSYKMDF